jgi:hypothetical protein
MRSISKALAPVVIAGTLAAATPAFAHSDWCLTNAVIQRFECSTNAIPPSTHGHIYFEVSAFSNFNLLEVNGPLLISSSAGLWGYSRTVFGLVGSGYYVTVRGPNNLAYINNT